MAAFPKKSSAFALICAGLFVAYNDCGSDAYNISAPSVAKFVATGYPQYASSAGGSTITLNGIGFTPQTQVLVGGLPCQSLHYNSSTVVTCVAPAHAVGSADITLVSAGAQSVTLSQGVEYGEYFTWMSGSNAPDQAGIYGTRGMTSATNFPGARYAALSLTDKAGHLWLFGGFGADSTGNENDLNDLWKYDGTSWTWVAGGNLVNSPALNAPVYGLPEAAASSNLIGARSRAAGWVDLKGNVWIFGGNGYGINDAGGFLNDLWEFNGTDWIWIAGSASPNQPANYGTMGMAGTPVNPTDPGARAGSATWTDSSGNFWLFGGEIFDPVAGSAYSDDLWKFNGTSWIWVGGSNTVNNPGMGMKNNSAPGNLPAARTDAITWTDASGNFWLFGGQISANPVTYLNDLWKFDGTNWTWVSGSSVGNQMGIYGTQGVAAGANVPGARFGSANWIDSHGNFWLFGGYGNDSVGTQSLLNDLWKFDGTNWTWVSGPNLANGTGSFGIKGTPIIGNLPSARYQPVSWADSGGNFWLLGGNADGTYLNDLWRFQP